MKKGFIIGIVCLLIVAVVIGIFFIKNNQGSNKADTNDDHPIVGQWKYNSYSSDYIYTFYNNGTGVYNAAGQVMTFTYTVYGDNISILYTGNTAPFETVYSINGDTLNIKDSFGNDTLYNKVK